MISVVMATYNGEKYLEKQLSSIFQQTKLPDEIVIVDDCSTDQTFNMLEIIKQDSNIPIVLIKNEHNQGVIKSFHSALEKCCGDYIFLADQDDIWLNTKVELMMASMLNLENETDESILVHSDLTVIDSSLTTLHQSFMRYYWQNFNDFSRPFESLVFRNRIPGCSMLINKALKEKSLPISADCLMHDYWIALIASLSGKIFYLDKPLMLYRRHLETITNVDLSPSPLFSRLKRALWLTVTLKYRCKNIRWQKKIVQLKAIDGLLKEPSQKLKLTIKYCEGGFISAIYFFLKNKFSLGSRAKTGRLYVSIFFRFLGRAD